MDLLLHICCAPDATTGFERFSNDWKITGLFYNPNIEPFDEYVIREQQSVFLASWFDITSVEGSKDQAEWLKVVEGYGHDPEKGERCKRCIRHRLERTASYAVNAGIKSFATTLTTSPHKDVDFIHDTGSLLAEIYNLEYIAETLRKRNGFARSIELCRKFGLYRQNYCGCRWSLQNKLKSIVEKAASIDI